MRFVCDQGCVEEGTRKNPPPRTCPEHGSRFVYEKEMRRGAPLRRVSKKREATVHQQGSTLAKGRGFAVAPAQRKKVKNLPCMVSGEDRYEGATIHPAHLWDRSVGGCDDPLCVGPLRADLHQLYDERKLNLLPFLISRGYWAEMAHVVEAHEVSPAALVERLSSGLWVLKEKAEVAKRLERPDREAVA